MTALFLFSRPLQVPPPPALRYSQYFMQHTQESIDENSEQGTPNSTTHGSHSISTPAIGLTEAQGVLPFIPLCM